MTIPAVSPGETATQYQRRLEYHLREYPHESATQSHQEELGDPVAAAAASEPGPGAIGDPSGDLFLPPTPQSSDDANPATPPEAPSEASERPEDAQTPQGPDSGVAPEPSATEPSSEPLTNSTRIEPGDPATGLADAVAAEDDDIPF